MTNFITCGQMFWVFNEVAQNNHSHWLWQQFFVDDWMNHLCFC
ncbi:hypothetical protein AC87_4856 [Escherichia coli 3-105-05_S4_C1]|nr:hypothetical protein AC87_4856 [Escherichia coli 3-105-05_S4_C1]